jgi:orotidine-5'-phosphate decarboxylase
MPELVLALDVDKKEAVKIIAELGESVKYYKIGHRLFTEDPGIITTLNKKGKRVFIDLKYHDIPTVVGLAVEEITKRYSPFALTIHTSGGREMMRKASQARDKGGGKTKPLIFGVTLLTSLSGDDLAMLGIPALNLKKHISKLAVTAKECGLDGVVCSGHEISPIKSACGKDFLTLVPGISAITTETSGGIQNDQKRTVSLAEAAERGADFIVAGRLVYRSNSPKQTAVQINGYLKTV